MYNYIVSGTKRTGTSMMMHCIQEGGLGLAWDKDRDQVIRKLRPRNHNPYFYELSPASCEDILKHGNKCVKMLGTLALYAASHPLRIVYMRRAYKAQAQSIKFSLGEFVVPGAQDRNNDFFLNALLLSERVDSLTVLDYDDVLQDPLKSFRTLRDDGWPIDPAKAALGVDTSLKHY